MCSEPDLATWVADATKDLQTPGIAVGVRFAGREHYTFHGVTSTPNPLAVDETTVFHWASLTKTFTATILMQLAERGLVELDAPVRTYLPELRLDDPTVLDEVTLLHLLNHTAGWSGDVPFRAEAGGSPVASFVAAMSGVPQLTRPGAVVVYNNASFILAGRIIELVTGRAYPTALRELVLDPLALTETFEHAADIMTRRFAVGHELGPDGARVVGPWPAPAHAAPAGSLGGTARDLIAWARFHLAGSDDAGSDDVGAAVLSSTARASMRQATAQADGSALGDAVGIGWFLREMDGIRLAGHSGVATGQVARLDLAAEHDFAICTLTNCGTTGPRIIQRLHARAMAELLGIHDATPTTRAATAGTAAELVGHYSTEELLIDVTFVEDTLVMAIRVAPRNGTDGSRHETGETFDVPVALITPANDDTVPSVLFVATAGQFDGVRGRFLRDDSGVVDAVDFGGRLARRVSPLQGAGR